MERGDFKQYQFTTTFAQEAKELIRIKQKFPALPCNVIQDTFDLVRDTSLVEQLL